MFIYIYTKNGSTGQFCSPFRTTTHPNTRRKWINELALLAISHPKGKKLDQQVCIARHFTQKMD